MSNRCKKYVEMSKQYWSIADALQDRSDKMYKEREKSLDPITTALGGPIAVTLAILNDLALRKEQMTFEREADYARSKASEYVKMCCSEDAYVEIEDMVAEGRVELLATAFLLNSILLKVEKAPMDVRGKTQWTVESDCLPNKEYVFGEQLNVLLSEATGSIFASYCNAEKREPAFISGLLYSGFRQIECEKGKTKLQIDIDFNGDAKITCANSEVEYENEGDRIKQVTLGKSEAR